LLASTTVLLMAPVEMPPSEVGFGRNISGHTQLDSRVFHDESGGTLWLHRPDVVIIKVLVGLQAVVTSGLTDAG
jgi:hypothetical protein